MTNQTDGGKLLELAAIVRLRCVEDENGCLLWTGYRNSRGYGQKWDGKRNQLTHRIMYQAVKGPIPEGLCLDHLCRNPPCCNPAHLEAVTFQENTRRGLAGQHARERAQLLTHCTNGHEITEQNTYTRKDGRRQCNVCAKARTNATYARNRERGLTQAGSGRQRALSRTAMSPKQLMEAHNDK
jgi:hypothetical protein